MSDECCNKCCTCQCKCNELEIHLSHGGKFKTIKLLMNYEKDTGGISSYEAGQNLAEYLYHNTNYRFIGALKAKLTELKT